MYVRVLFVVALAGLTQVSLPAAGVKAGAPPQNQSQRISLHTRLVNATVTVTDSYGRFVTGLRKEQFEVYDDKVRQQIAHFSDADAPISLGIVYDVSGSMKGRIQRSFSALKRFLETSHRDDDTFLMAFNDRPSLVQDFTTSTDRLLSRMMFVKPSKGTALYDAVYLALEKVQQGRHSKKALLLISDGQDNHSRYSFREMRKRTREADVLVYAIGITNPYTDYLAGQGMGILESTARATGGRAFFPSSNGDRELVDIFTRIALELRHQYSIGFYPTGASDKRKWHKLKVKVTVKGLGRLSISYRSGYPGF